MADTYAGLTVTTWAVIGGLFVVVLILIDRWIHCSRNFTQVCQCVKEPPDPLAGAIEQPPKADESGFKREHDSNFERNWHMVALQRDETEEDAERIIERREKEAVKKEFESKKAKPVTIVGGIATMGGIQTE